MTLLVNGTKWSFSRVSLFWRNEFIIDRYISQNSGHYLPSCLLFKIHRFGYWALSASAGGTYLPVSRD
jgi:hypothetical protein